jgi:L-threonylcarbamoyladenylate synthase
MQLYDAASLSDGGLEKILSFLRAGGVIAFPTDTAYGLGADPFQEEAVQQIFRIKGRPEAKPILLLVNSIAMAESVASLSSREFELAKRFWPGPLTMVVPARSTVPNIVTAGTGTIGIRWPDAAFARRLIDAFERPITATSANRTGMPSAITVAEIREQLQDSVDLIVEGGTLPTRGGSTLLDLTEVPARLLREGPIPRAELSDVLR